MLRKYKTVACIILIVALLTMFTGCKRNTMGVLINNLKELYSNNANRFDFVSSHTVVIDKTYKASTELGNFFMSILPEKLNVDFGLTMFYNPSELRISGYVAGTHETALLFKELQLGIDMDFDLYANKDEGVFLKSDDGFRLIKEKHPEWTAQPSKDNWLKIGSVDEAKAVFEAFDKLKNSEYAQQLFEENIKEIETTKDENGYNVKAEVNLKEIIKQLIDDKVSQTKLYKRINDLFASVNIVGTYTINENNLLTQTSYVPTSNEDTTELSKVVKSIDGIIYRFTYKSSTEKSLKPDGEYK